MGQPQPEHHRPHTARQDDASECALNREPRARTRAEAEFLAIGDGAGLWLAEAAAAGTTRVRAKMARAVQMAVLHGAEPVDRALGQAAAAGRFADGDLAVILAHQASAAPGEPSRAGEGRTLAQGHQRLGAPRRQAGGRPVTATRHDDGAIVLTSHEAARIRQALVACTGIFDQVKAIGGQALKALEEAALDAPDDGRPLAQVHYDACLAVDYIDFAQPARRPR